MQFHETRYGAKFFDGQLPKLIEALTDIAAALKAPKPVYQLQQALPEDFLADLYHGNYDPSDLPNSAEAKELTPEIIAVQTQLREIASPEIWTLIERYRSLLDGRGVAEREQAFSSGFRLAAMMFAAGLACPATPGTEVSRDA